MSRALKATWILLLALAPPAMAADSVNATSGANTVAETIDRDDVKRALETANPGEEAYIDFVCALVDQGTLPRRLFVSTFQWARGKPYPKKVQYFKFAMITQAAKLGIDLPRNAPTRQDIDGRVVQTVGLVKVPVAGAAVSLGGTGRTTHTNFNGRFTFRDVPFGTRNVDATSNVLGIPMSGSVRVSLPTLHGDSVSVEIELHVGR